MAQAPTLDPAAPAVRRTGLIQAISAYLLWGFLPLYFLLLKAVGPGEIVAHRILFSVVALLAVVAIAGRWRQLRAAIANPRVMGLLTLSAAFISVNWLTYIWSVQNGHVLASSLGYYLNPLVNVVLGMVAFRERLNRAQMVAVALATAGVAILAVGAGTALWISLTLALAFGFYGMVRKIAPVDALEGLLVETLILAPIALGYLILLAQSGALAIGRDAGESALMIGSGIVTAVPLLLFAAATKRLPYSTVGLLQYIGPTIQFVLAVTLLGETLTADYILCFALIWTGLFVYAGSGVMGSLRLRRERAAAARA
ncbi:EamA family transporter RarD [Sphingomonas sp. SFZ2018-12]|uniref:EamA family transporter RarD n=1 Tax=Sphingomonas sp. SFZ2018-12 TaxID=2683197 RepID=UPI001F0FA664|nr:EamA family transporter RarD [Sphingomonas sp. SFZ2018-12]MCH4891744.1 EamA family transporter RarD [Sphingomonas sp. SFZ2018-12]